MVNIKKTVSKMVAVLISAATIASTGVIGAGAYATYGSSSTAYASKSGYNFYKYGASKLSYTDILNVSGKNRFVIPQVLVFKPNSKGEYTTVDYSKSNAGILQKNQGRFALVSQSSSYRRYWHRGVLKEDTSYSSSTYHIFEYNIYF